MWKPIETAPKDQDILLYYPGEGDVYGVIQGWYFSSAKEIDDGWETVIGFVGEPTHWMPLPSPPTNKK